MRRLRTVCVALALSTCLFALLAMPGAAAGQIVVPSALHLPYGAKVATDLNFSNSDVLGLIRELLPAAGELVRLGAVGGPVALGHACKSPISPESFSRLDFKPLSEVLEGVTNFRFIIARYRASLPANQLLAQFDAGATKAGGFTKIVTDFSLGPGPLAVYAQPDGAGYILYDYDADTGALYAARLSGRIDMAKLMKWIGDTIKLLMPASPPQTGGPKPAKGG